MAEPKINTTNGLKQYMLRKLGIAGHTIELTDDNLTDAIDDTVDDFIMYAYAGTMERHIPVQLIAGVQEYLLPYDVMAVTTVNDMNSTMIGANMPSNLFSINQFIAADLYKPGAAKIDLLGYEMINQMTSTIDLIFAKKKSFDFNSVSKILMLHGVVRADEKVILQVYRNLDLDSTPLTAGSNIHAEDNIYNERWVKRMSTARAKLQWGVNLMKYQGSVLPNGGTLNSQGIMESAEREIEALTLELHDTYRYPTDFMVG